jgi:phospholipid/cholesterol/gamma-HCH transport system ATP-binding protein
MSAPEHINGNVSVAVRDLRRSFDTTEVLKGISFDVKPGETFVIMGPSGSGKSVLLKHIIGLEEPNSGEILIAGQSVHGSEVLSKYRVAMVFQSGALLKSLTVGQNVGLYLTEHRLREPEEVAQIVADKLEAVGLKGLEDRMPNELSGGMQKRVALARALVIDPQLVLFDEPTSELDPLMSVTIGEQIMLMRERLHPTILVVTHDRDLAFGIADRIAMIDDGQIRFIGTPDEVKHSRDPMIQKFIHAELTNS